MEQFLKTFNEVFDKDNKVKSCGRVKCIELIELAKQIDNTKNYGDITTGFMKVDNLIELRNNLVHTK